ncbi:MAG TPA: hypothetical protein VHG08_20825 [Longimicrobium sp.]|nr:hypothetical protein [Longimicrobium sp.]
MSKLTLDPCMLHVESFAPAGSATGSSDTIPGPGGSADYGDTDLDVLTCAGSCPPDC